MLRFLDRMEEIFCASALLATALILFVNVTLRYIFSASTSWAEELIKYLMIWITFIGGSVCVRRGAHIRMDFLLGKLSDHGKENVNKLVYLISAVFCGSLMTYGVQMVMFNFRSGQVSPALKLPMWIVYAAVPIGSGLMTFRFIQRTIGAREESD